MIEDTDDLDKDDEAKDDEDDGECDGPVNCGMSRWINSIQSCVYQKKRSTSNYHHHVFFIRWRAKSPHKGIKKFKNRKLLSDRKSSRFGYFLEWGLIELLRLGVGNYWSEGTFGRHFCWHISRGPGSSPRATHLGGITWNLLISWFQVVIKRHFVWSSLLCCHWNFNPNTYQIIPLEKRDPLRGFPNSISKTYEIYS